MQKFKVISAQFVSEDCIVCGTKNPVSMHAHFYNLENELLYACMQTLPEHQSYPGRTHGGVASAIIDEMVGRSVNSKLLRALGREDVIYGTTMNLSVKYRKPLPYGEPLYAVARCDKENSRFMEGQAYLYTMDGTLCVEGNARYIKLAPELIDENAITEKSWFEDPVQVPDFVEIPRCCTIL